MRLPALVLLAMACTAALAQPSPTFHVGGIVVDAVTSTPLPGTDVLLQSTADPRQQSWLTAGDGGRFSFDHLAAGKYILSARRRGYALQGFDQHENFITGIVVGPGLDTSNLVFRLRPECAISGRITDEHNEAVRQAQVYLFRAGLAEGSEGLRRIRESTTDDTGAYHFRHLAPGTYYVAVAGRPWYAAAASSIASPRPDRPLTPEEARERSALNVAYPLTFYPQAANTDDAEAIVLHPGDGAVADVNLQPVPALTLRLPGDMRSMRSIQLVLPDGSLMGANAGVANGPGGMEITGLAPGRYDVSLSSTDSGSMRTTEQQVDLSRDTTLSAGAASPSVSGSVDLGGASCRHCAVLLESSRSHQRYFATVGSEGAFQFAESPAPGTYGVFIFGSPDGYVKALKATGATVSGREITLSAGDTVILSMALGRGIGTIEGIARNGERAVAGAMILLLPDHWPQDAALVRRDQSDSDGSFTLPNIVPGTYTVLAIDNGWDLEWQQPEVLRPFLAAAQRVQVAPGGVYKITAAVQSAAR